jgi:hypothetical protein
MASSIPSCDVLDSSSILCLMWTVKAAAPYLINDPLALVLDIKQPDAQIVAVRDVKAEVHCVQL